MRYGERAFPPYRYVPGRNPHPTHDPAGHSRDRGEAAAPSLLTTDWRRCADYLHGIDLFNHRYWWESHEMLEGLWHATGHATPTGHGLQALIQCAVVHLHVERGKMEGARKLLESAARHVAAAEGADLGVDLPALHAASAAHVDDPSREPVRISLNGLAERA